MLPIDLEVKQINLFRIRTLLTELSIVLYWLELVPLLLLDLLLIAKKKEIVLSLCVIYSFSIYAEYIVLLFKT